MLWQKNVAKSASFHDSAAAAAFGCFTPFLTLCFSPSAYQKPLFTLNYLHYGKTLLQLISRIGNKRVKLRPLEFPAEATKKSSPQFFLGFLKGRYGVFPPGLGVVINKSHLDNRCCCCRRAMVYFCIMQLLGFDAQGTEHLYEKENNPLQISYKYRKWKSDQ